jgi:hypothetical protein
MVFWEGMGDARRTEVKVLKSDLEMLGKENNVKEVRLQIVFTFLHITKPQLTG